MSPGGRAFRAQAARCEQLLARHLAAAVATWGRSALDVIDLPPIGSEAIDAESLRVAAVLFWLAELEAAGIPGFVEALAEAMMSGRLLLDVGAAGDALADWWRRRSERFSPDERQALFQRLFDNDTGFPEAFERLAEQLDAIGRMPAGTTPTQQRSAAAQAAVAAQGLAGPLAQRATGIAAFAARELTAQARTALELLERRELDTALGGQGPWGAIRMHARELLGRDLDAQVHLARARAGHELLAWLADHAAEVGAGRLSLPPGDRGVAAAQDWLAAEQSWSTPSP
jgi:hypothetical protein